MLIISRMMQDKNESNVKITEIQFIDNEGNNEVDIKYPMISGLETEEKDNQINDLIKKDILELVYDDPLHNEKGFNFIWIMKLN